MPRNHLSSELKHYLLVTGNYWAFTLTDGALRMLVVLYFYQLGYGALQIATLFLFYEIFGVITNLLGGYLGARIGLNRTMNLGLAMQVVALLMLAVPAPMLSMAWVMSAQALSGMAKDLNKMSAKSAIKYLAPAQASARGNATLFKWVALLTGSKNALKGLGFFLGGTLLSLFGFTSALLFMAAALAVVWLASLYFLRRDLGKAKNKPKFSALFAKTRAINLLSAARVFLFAARDLWFVVALPVYLSSQLGWTHWWVGGFLAAWTIAYGLVQAFVPTLLRTGSDSRAPVGREAAYWAALLALLTGAIGLALVWGFPAEPVLIGGLLLFGLVFAINSALHSYLIVSYAEADAVSLDVGFYYMANALGRLLGTVLSGWVYQAAGLAACLAVASGFVALAALISLGLPGREAGKAPSS